MANEIFDDFRNSLKERLANPFITTFITVLLIQNWELIYTVFNFESDYDRVERIAIIKTYINSGWPLYKSLLWSVFWALEATMLYYVSINISRLFKNLSIKYLKPMADKIGRYKVATVEELDEQKSLAETLQSEYAKLITQNSTLKESLRKAEEKNDKYIQDSVKATDQDFYNIFNGKWTKIVNDTSTIIEFKDGLYTLSDGLSFITNNVSYNPIDRSYSFTLTSTSKQNKIIFTTLRMADISSFKGTEYPSIEVTYKKMIERNDGILRKKNDDFWKNLPDVKL